MSAKFPDNNCLYQPVNGPLNNNGIEEEIFNPWQIEVSKIISQTATPADSSNKNSPNMVSRSISPLSNSSPQQSRDVSDIVNSFNSKSREKLSGDEMQKCCEIADKEKEKAMTEGKGRKISGKAHQIRRTVLVGPHGEETLVGSHVKAARNEEGIMSFQGTDAILGNGGFKIVKNGTDMAEVSNDREKAVAICAKKWCSNESEWNLSKEMRIPEELKMMEACKGIPQALQLDYYVYDAASEKWYIVMPKCNGGSLSNKFYVPEKEKREWIRQIGLGLEQIHARNILHLDIKLDNVLLHNGEIKICDFGLACEANNKERIYRSRGTDGYKAPEKYVIVTNEEGQRSFAASTDKCDAWSLGCLIFELLEGYNPFIHTNAPNKWQFNGESLNLTEWQNWIDRVIRTSDNISQGHKHLLSGLLQMDPNKRWDIARFNREFDETFYDSSIP